MKDSKSKEIKVIVEWSEIVDMQHHITSRDEAGAGAALVPHFAQKSNESRRVNLQSLKTNLLKLRLRAVSCSMAKKIERELRNADNETRQRQS